MFAYQLGVKQAREAAKSSAADSNTVPPAVDVKVQTRNLSLNRVVADMSVKDMAGKDAAGKAAAMETPEGGNTNTTMNSSDAMQPAAPKPPPQPLNIIQKTFRAEALARLQRASTAESRFSERLVTFWSNHFCISASKGELARMWAGSFEREAIRPHVLGKFSDMLLAVEQHPAMLFFLDNQQSLGPDSRAGQNRKARVE